MSYIFGNAHSAQLGRIQYLKRFKGRDSRRVRTLPRTQSAYLPAYTPPPAKACPPWPGSGPGMSPLSYFWGAPAK